MSDSSPKEEAQAAQPADASSVSSENAPPTSSATPTLNNLLNKPSSAESTPAPTQTSSGPPSNATVPFGSPQASPVPNGSSAKPPPPAQQQPPPQQQLPVHGDSYAATAAAVAAGAGSYPMPKNPGLPPGHPQAMYEQGHPPQHLYYGQPPPPHHPYWQQQLARYPGPPPQGSPYYPPQAYAPQYYAAPHQAPQPMLMQQHRPPPVPDYIKAQQQRDGAATPAAIGGQLVPQSPGGASSVAGGEDSGLDAAKSPSWAARGAPQPSTSAAAGTPGIAPQNMPPQPVPPGKNIQSIVDKLTGPVTEQNPARVMPDRRRFFESLVLFCEQNGDPITAPPQVSKQNIDLHRLYIAVRSKGGFMEVTKSKTWKLLCQQASSAITESSAAGYQLRKHYEKYLLKMECAETHRSYDDMIEFANKLKKKKKPTGDRDSTGGPGSSEVGVATPATPGQQHTAPPSAASTPAPAGAPGAPPMQQPPPQATPAPASAVRPGQAPPPPGYHAGPPPPGADPNVAYYYPQQQPHGWPQGVPPQGYPYGAPRMPPPQSFEEQQRYYQQHPHMQQPMPQQPPAQQQPPANTLQVDVASGSQVNSRAPSTGPAVGTPDSSSQMSAPGTGEDAANRPQSRPAVAPTPPASIAQQQQPPQGYYPGAAPSTSYGSPRPPAPRPTYPMAAEGASTSAAYPPGLYTPGSHPPPMWQQQPRYPGQPQVSAQQQQMQPPQGYSQQRRHVFPPYHLAQPGGPPGAPSPGSSAAAQMRARYGAQPPQPGPPQGAVPQAAATPSMMSSRSQNAAMPPSVPAQHHAPATTAALMSAQNASGQQQQQQQSIFPPGCVEATQVQMKRRRKVYAKELAGVTPKRVMMSLRSALDTEVVWAVNALNVILYDDTNQQAMNAFSISQQPELLNLVVEHLTASVAVLFPDVFNKDKSNSTVPFNNIPTIPDDGFWPSSEEEKVSMKQIVSSRNSSDFNKVSRFGRGVRVEKKKLELPLELRRYRPVGFEVCNKENQDNSSSKKNNTLGTGLGERVTEALKNNYKLECKLMKEPEVPGMKRETPEQKAPDVKEESLDESTVDLGEIKPAEWTEHVSVKATVLTSKFEALQKLAHRCTALSNILRGYSFLPGNEGPMARHAGLLYLIGRFLKLRCDEISFATKRRERAEAAYAKLKETDEEQLDSAQNNANGSSVFSKCVDIEDDATKIMDDLANQLRDDAFVILCHLSVQLKLEEHDSVVSWPIFDGLVHWIVTKSVTAKDPLIPSCVLPPRAYALEILCKMSVIEQNVDLLIATGPWTRFEAFLERLASWLTMSEEPHYREFSLVILNAICNLSDEAVYFTCLHTPALSHIVYFLEFTDTAMHSVVTQQGMTALRDSPELMGTSVGMLRRAATLLHSFCRVEECRKLFIKQQQRLLALSMSQLMDSRVAQMIVETLYEVPRAEDEAAATMQAKEEVKKPKKEEERDSPMVTAANDDASSSAASTSSPEHKAAETEEKEEKLTNGTPVSEGSPAPSNDSLFRAPKMKRRPSSPVASLENGSNGDCKKRRRLENGTNGKKLNGSIEVDHTATTKNSMAAVA